MTFGPDYALRWPVSLFCLEVARLLNHRDDRAWSAQAECLLEDAFVTAIPRQDFPHESLGAIGWNTPPAPRAGLTPQQKFMRQLLDSAHVLPKLGTVKPYYSAREAMAKQPQGAQTLGMTIRAFSRLVFELDNLCYFEEVWGKSECPDNHEGDPRDVIQARLDHDESWPMDFQKFEARPELFFDLIEVLYDLASAPTTTYTHDYAGCGRHGLTHSRQRGRIVYAWRVNQILGKSSLNLRLSTDGEDAGRLVSESEPALGQLVTEMLAEPDTTEGQVPHAVALYRKRNGTPHEKRSAVVALANVLEERRTLLKAELVKGDEGALFEIANKFSVRHQSENQHKDFDPAFYDWFFWWYLATINLTDAIIARQAGETP